MGEAFGDPEELKVVTRGLGFEVEARPFAEVRGVAAEIDGDVPDMAGEDADEFALRLAKLVVQAAEHTLDREGLVILDEMGREARSRKG
jgi:predicted lipoprotein